jgi:predicted metallopeptidase
MPLLNLTREIERLIADIVCRMEEFSHIDPGRIMTCIASTRGGGVHGTYAKIHPLRFENGSRTTLIRRRRGTTVYEIPPVVRGGVEMLYIIYFLVPRFLNLPLNEKLATIIHELYHISPEFNGDIRRFPGKNFAHGSSRKRYNALMADFAARYLKKTGDGSGTAFLEGDMAAMRARHGAIVGRKMAAPRLRVVEPGR